MFHPAKQSSVSSSLFAFLAIGLAASAVFSSAASAQAGQTLTGQAAFTDWNQQKPGIRHKITVADLPQPYATESSNNQPHVVPRPENAWPIAPAGFKVTLYAGGDTTPMQRADNVEHMTRSSGTFTEPRLITVAPNGDLFLADSGAGEVIVLRGMKADGKAAQIATYASGLDHPFGIAFYPAENPRYVYVANTSNVVRFAYHAGDLHATAQAETVVAQLAGWAQLTGGGHWTRDVVFTKDGRHMLVSVGSGSNIDNPDNSQREFHRADVLEYTPDGKFEEVYAHGIRNCVGEAINPTTGQLWCSVNERDELGNHLVPDYVTSVPEGGFFGWPWYYMGGHSDPRLPQPCANGTGPNPQLTAPLTSDQAKGCKRTDMSAKVLTPDVIVQPHMASLELAFYPGFNQFSAFTPAERIAMPDSRPFPSAYQGGAFAAEHGSWNRLNRAGYEVIFIPMHAGHATGEYEDFLTGFLTPDGQVWGRPVGVAMANDGSLFVTDDGSRSVWHVTYTGK